MEEIGNFGLSIKLFRDNGEFIPIFRGLDKNMPKEIIISQLKSFLKKLEDEYNADFKGDITKINGAPEE